MKELIVAVGSENVRELLDGGYIAECFDDYS